MICQECDMCGVPVTLDIRFGDRAGWRRDGTDEFICTGCINGIITMRRQLTDDSKK